MDKLDKQILRLLEIDARQSKARIAKQLDISKATVTYRINRLSKNGVITGYRYLMNQAKLGSVSFGLLLKLRDLNLAEQEDLYERIIKTKKFAWLAVTSGEWDMIAVVVKHDLTSFTKDLDDFFSTFGEHIQEYKFYMDYEGLISGHTYLYDEPAFEPVSYSRPDKKLALRDLDRKLCEQLRKEPTLSLLRIATRLAKTYDTIQAHYHTLIRAGILLKCVPIINHDILGYKNTLCLYSLSPKPERLADVWRFCAKHPNIVRQARCLGHFNLALNIHGKDNRQLKEILSEFNKEFSDIIISYDLVESVNTTK